MKQEENECDICLDYGAKKGCIKCGKYKEEKDFWCDVCNDRVKQNLENGDIIKVCKKHSDMDFSPKKPEWEEQLMELWEKHHYLKKLDRVGYIHLFDDIKHLLARQREEMMDIVNKWSAKTDEGSEEVDRLFLHLKDVLKNK